MRYGLAFRYFLDRPGGFTNLLLVSVCLLIPAVGPILLHGYQAEVAERLIRDPELRARAIESGVEEVRRAGFEILATADSVLEGPKGNLEAFVHARMAETEPSR